MPARIIDCHAHCNLAEHATAIPDEKLQFMFSTFPWFNIEDSRHVQTVLFPSKDIRTLRFANAFGGIDFGGANNYLAAQSPATDRVALYGLPDDIQYTVDQLKTGKYTALKMYHQYLTPPATKVYEYFRPEILATAQDLDIPIILHLPKMITQALDQIERLVADFPRLRVTLAHLGLPHLPVPGLAEAYKYVASFENVFMDSAMIPSAEVVQFALESFGSDRIMYGSDEPLNLVRSVVYRNPELGERLATEYQYHWVDPVEHEQHGHLAKGAIHIQWKALGAIRIALRRLDWDTMAIREKIFFDNAASYYGFL